MCTVWQDTNEKPAKEPANKKAKAGPGRKKKQDRIVLVGVTSWAVCCRCNVEFQM